MVEEEAPLTLIVIREGIAAFVRQGATVETVVIAKSEEKEIEFSAESTVRNGFGKEAQTSSFKGKWDSIPLFQEV